MAYRKSLSLFACMLAGVLLIVPAFAQGERGKAELKAGSGSITVDYGRPSLQGRDPLSMQKEGSSWRMGKDAATTLTTPVDLMFGATKIAKGSYTLQLLKVSADRYELVFSPKAGEGGMGAEAAKDAAKAAMKKEAAQGSVEIFTIELKQAPKGGTFLLTWGTARLSVDFQTAN